MDEIYLNEIRRQPQRRQLRLTFSDGHSADYDYDYLRGFCPCAGCQGHGGGAVEFHPPARSVTPGTIEPVGNYAIAIGWSDGHTTGIYRFAFLRELCPCEKCAAQRSAAPAS